MTSGSEALRLSGPTLPAATTPDQALEALDELHDTLANLGWTAFGGQAMKITGRIHLTATADEVPNSPAVRVYATSDSNRGAARRRATAAQLAAATS